VQAPYGSEWVLSTVVDSAVILSSWAFLCSIRRREIDPYAFQQTKTRHVLQHLAAFASA
jgi:phosphopantetheinyl transferase